MGKRFELLSLATSAKVYDLGQPLEIATPVSPNHPPFRMALMRRHGDLVRADGTSGANELLSLGGHTGTHIDALCHASKNGLLHGGLDAQEASIGGRFKQLGVDTIAPIVRRGVLLDIAGLLGIKSLPGGHRITAEELEAACVQGAITVKPGDAVLIRTGWPVSHWHDPIAFVGFISGVPGPDEGAARWLASKQVFLVGADTIAFEWIAPEAGHSLLPVHAILLVEEGIHILEVLNLEGLAQDGIREFVFVASPLKIVGATGSPVRPLALVQ